MEQPRPVESASGAVPKPAFIYPIPAQPFGRVWITPVSELANCSVTLPDHQPSHAPHLIHRQHRSQNPLPPPPHARSLPTARPRPASASGRRLVALGGEITCRAFRSQRSRNLARGSFHQCFWPAAPSHVYRRRIAHRNPFARSIAAPRLGAAAACGRVMIQIGRARSSLFILPGNTPIRWPLVHDGHERTATHAGQGARSCATTSDSLVLVQIGHYTMGVKPLPQTFVRLGTTCRLRAPLAPRAMAWHPQVSSTAPSTSTMLISLRTRQLVTRRPCPRTEIHSPPGAVGRTTGFQIGAMDTFPDAWRFPPK